MVLQYFYRTGTVLTFKWQYMTGAGAGAGTEIRDKGGAGAKIRLRNTDCEQIICQAVLINKI